MVKNGLFAKLFSFLIFASTIAVGVVILGYITYGAIFIWRKVLGI